MMWTLIIYGLPILITVLFFVNLGRFLWDLVQGKRNPETINPQKRKRIRIDFLVSGIFFLLLVLLIVALFLILSMAVAYM